MLRRPRSGRPSRGGRRRSSGRQTGSSTSPSVFRPDHERQRLGQPARPPAPAGAAPAAARGACAPGGAVRPAPARRRCRRPSPLRPGCSTLRRPRSGRPNGGQAAPQLWQTNRVFNFTIGVQPGSRTATAWDRRLARPPPGWSALLPAARGACAPTGACAPAPARPGADAAGRACFEPGVSMLRRPRSGRPSRGGRRRSSGRRTSPSPSVLSRSSSSQRRGRRARAAGVRRRSFPASRFLPALQTSAGPTPMARPACSTRPISELRVWQRPVRRG